MWINEKNEAVLEPHEIEEIAQAVVKKIKIIGKKYGISAEQAWDHTVTAFDSKQSSRISAQSIKDIGNA